LQVAPGSSPLTFVNIWTVGDHDKQQQLLSAMKADVAEIISKPGSRGMAFHSSTDGTRVAVYAQWDSLEAFNQGIANDPTAQGNRVKLAQFGEPNANTYSIFLWLQRRPERQDHLSRTRGLSINANRGGRHEDSALERFK